MNAPATSLNQSFMEALREQRWDDHCFYHHSRINQSLHFLSAMCFLASYVLLFVSPVLAIAIGWLLAMVLRQSGHFFFEPKGFDEANQVTHEHKEAVKVGYNLRRKVVLLSLWAVAPLVIRLAPDAFAFLDPVTPNGTYLERVAMLWFFLGAGAVLFRVIQLAFIRDLKTGLVWATKILTDPFHDVMIYWKSPFWLMKGELYDPIVKR